MEPRTGEGPAVASVSRSGRDHPFRRLARHGGDEIEVVVVVEHNQSGVLRRSGDQEISDLGSAMLALLGQPVLDLDGPVEDPLIHRNEGPRTSGQTHRPVVARPA